MKEKRKSGKMIALVSILIIILCMISFILGSYYGINLKNDNKSENTEVTPAISDIPDGSADVTQAVRENTVTPQPTQENTVTPQAGSESDNIVYANTEFGFEFTLPASWDGYSILTENWQGTACTGDNAGDVIETGTKIIIRHPDWTNEKPRQDIPIMVFTLDQWKIVESEDMSVSAAPIGPSKLGSNSEYVFALPARYNFAYPDGYEEVEDIMASNPLIPVES
jgi:hypothetical protein